MYLKCQTCHTHITVWYICYRLIREITRREFEKRRLRLGDAPDLTKEELAAGKKTPVPSAG